MSFQQNSEPAYIMRKLDKASTACMLGRQIIDSRWPSHLFCINVCGFYVSRELEAEIYKSKSYYLWALPTYSMELSPS
jgi:hypothetical protein